MPANKKKKPPTSAPKQGRNAAVCVDADTLVATLRRLATKKTRDGLTRYAIPTDRAFGVTMSAIQKLARQLGHDHELAEALWETGWYEARLLAAFVAEPACVTRAQMDRWCRDFDNWGICDTVCFTLFDRSPHAWHKVHQWAPAAQEFVRRAAFALMACLAGHDKSAADAQFLALLPLIEHGAKDERNFVKKAVNWALRRIGERSLTLNAAAVAVATRLAHSEEAPCRWVGKDALRQLASPPVRARLARRTKNAQT